MSVLSARAGARCHDRRDWGVYYTPPFVVDYVLDGCLEADLDWLARSDARPLRILDPACGDGAFVMGAFQRLHDWYRNRCSQGRPLSAQQRLAIVRKHLFGVDVDRVAVERLQKSLLERVSPEHSLQQAALKTIRANIRSGDALTGHDFSSPFSWAAAAQEGSEQSVGALNWPEAFPQVAESGGFDVVVGNPPYRRELNAKEMFDRVARLPFGRKWRQARMDYWYYFLHRGLDLLRPDGRLAFIVNSYWTASSGASKLISRLEAETTLEEIALLGDAAIFADVAGRHLIVRLRRGRHRNPCRVIDLTETSEKLDAIFPSLPGDSKAGDPALSQTAADALPIPESYQIPQQELYRYGQLVLGRPTPWMAAFAGRQGLGELYEVRQGMAENPPVITSRHNREFGNRFRIGAGVFVLSPEEVERLNLSADEQSLLRPYYQTSAVRRYSLSNEPTGFVLYLTKSTASNLDRFPRIYRHLKRFRPILERRRETRNGSLPWWQLHWPREERLFTEPRILSVQMGQTPQFAWAETSTFVGFSINLILAESDGPLPLETLTGILNSTPARYWFERHAKHRGVNLEINGGLLKHFPLPGRNRSLEVRISRLASDRREETISAAGRPGQTAGMARTFAESGPSALLQTLPPCRDRDRIDELEIAIDELVCRLYGIKMSSLFD